VLFHALTGQKINFDSKSWNETLIYQQKRNISQIIPVVQNGLNPLCINAYSRFAILTVKVLHLSL
jgi:hypothetical protein